MSVSWPILFSFFVASYTTLAQPTGRRTLEWTKVEAGAFDERNLSGRGRRVLALEEITWRHAQSDHFVVHFEKEIFAKKVARMGEFFYAYTAADLKGVEDHVEGRSHIFIFRDPESWLELKRVMPDVQSWVFAFVQGPEMYLQQARDRKASANVLAHEMTHLILNRYFKNYPPTWLNEGLAEWYRTFGYAAFKGIKKSKRAQFKRLKEPYPLAALLSAEAYPSDTEQVSRFYETAKFIVAYLRLDWPEETFQAYLKDVVVEGKPSWEALDGHFGLSDAAAVEAGFRKFLR